MKARAILCRVFTPGISGQSPDNIVQSGLLHIADGGQLVNGESALLAKFSNPIDINI